MKRTVCHYRLIYTIVIFLLSSIHLSAQDFWTGSAFIETEDGHVYFEIQSIDLEVEEIADQLQPKKRKVDWEGAEATINMTYVVYEEGIIGKRPFGRIRYNIRLTKENDLLTGIIEDFTFRKIERSARYGKLEEVGGKPQKIVYAKKELTPRQWEIVRWKTELVLDRKIEEISSFQGASLTLN